jgi:hypothetical protein
MEKKSIPIGIKVISLILILPLLATLIMFFVTSMSKATLMLSDSKKNEIMQSAQWKRLNITTIEQFDAYTKKTIPSNNSNLMWGFFIGTIALILSIGLLKLKIWSRMGTVIYSCFTILMSILWFSPGASSKTPFLYGKFFSIVTYAIIIYYLNRPNIKEQFIGGKNL